ncbi:hypothetical protein JYU23_01670 [bacterium AH-315-C07]|nr:hypothetical protein [bacterium AH-315-C07]
MVVFHFWNSRDIENIRNFIRLNRVVNSLDQEGYTFLAINLDDKKRSMSKFLKKYKFKYQQIYFKDIENLEQFCEKYDPLEFGLNFYSQICGNNPITPFDYMWVKPNKIIGLIISTPRNNVPDNIWVVGLIKTLRYRKTHPIRKTDLYMNTIKY